MLLRINLRREQVLLLWHGKKALHAFRAVYDASVWYRETGSHFFQSAQIYESGSGNT